MTVSLTFDDGITAHATIVAPLLVKYGWRGAFNVVTDFLDPNPVTLTEEKLKILGLVNHSAKRMSWDDARNLLKSGHEVYPHSCTHEKLGELFKSGRHEELFHEIVDSIGDFEKRLGMHPRFFCCPHLDWTPEVRDLIRLNKVEMFNNQRPGFGTGATPRDVTRLLCRNYYEGRPHVDLMFHGIVEREGGHRPFRDEEEFEAILKGLKALEEAGKIRVEPYATAHRGYTRFGFFVDRWSWLRNKVRRVWFRLCFRDHHDATVWDGIVEGAAV